jgi:hypothetical protein
MFRVQTHIIQLLGEARHDHFVLHQPFHPELQAHLLNEHQTCCTHNTYNSTACPFLFHNNNPQPLKLCDIALEKYSIYLAGEDERLPRLW